MQIKKFIITAVFILLLLIIYGFFPTYDVFQQVVAIIIFFIIVPILFSKFFLKTNLSEIGLCVGDWKQGLMLSIISFLASSLAIFILIDFFDFLEKYPIPEDIIYSYGNFLSYVFIKILFVIVAYEFFFRGFLMLILEKKLKYWSIAAQFLIFILLAAATRSSFWLLLPYMIFAPFAGLIVYKSRSILYSSGFQFIALIILNAYLVYLIK